MLVIHATIRSKTFCPLVIANNKQNHKEPRTWTGSLDKRRKRLNKDKRFGTWNIRIWIMVGFLMTVSKELFRYRLDLVGVQEVRWEGSGTAPAGEYIFFYGKGN
jgi:hypothetical protein